MFLLLLTSKIALYPPSGGVLQPLIHRCAWFYVDKRGKLISKGFRGIFGG